MNWRTFGRLAVVALFSCPIFVLLWTTSWPELPPFNDLSATLLHSGLQATFSAVFSFFLGAMGALGLCWLSGSRWLAVVEIFVLLPTWMPPLFVILAVLATVTRWMTFPFGLFGVVAIHGLMNAGLVSVALARLLRARVGGQMELAWIEGASRSLLLRALWPELRRDFGLLFLLVFAVCFTSFSVPLIVGGVRASSLEIFIFQQLYSGGDLKLAAGVGLVEIVIMALLALILGREATPPRQVQRQLGLLGSPLGLIVPLSLSLLSLGGSVLSWSEGYRQLGEWPEVLAEMPILLRNSLFVGLGTGALTVGLMVLLAYLFPQGAFRRWLLGYSAPSAVLVGLMLLMVGPATGGLVLVKIVCGLALILFPALYRWLTDAPLMSLKDQVQAARVLGASWSRILIRVILPQISPELGRVGALAAFWGASDFALSRLVAHQDVTLALLMDRLLSSYRLEIAAWLLGPLVAVSVLAGAVFLGAGYVVGRKLSSGLR